MVVSLAVRRVCFLVLFVLFCPGLTGCGMGAKDGGNPFVPTEITCREAKLFVMGLDYIIRSSETERIDSAFNDLGQSVAEGRRPDWGEYVEVMEKLSVLSGQVKSLLEQKPPKLEEARPKVDEMMKLSDQLPGDDVQLEERWGNLRKF